MAPFSLQKGVTLQERNYCNTDQLNFRFWSNLILCFRPYDAKNPYLAPVKVNRELHKGGDRSCLHIEFDITGSKIRYVWFNPILIILFLNHVYEIFTSCNIQSQNLWQVGGFLRILQFPPPIKLTATI